MARPEKQQDSPLGVFLGIRSIRAQWGNAEGAEELGEAGKHRHKQGTHCGVPWHAVSGAAPGTEMGLLELSVEVSLRAILGSLCNHSLQSQWCLESLWSDRYTLMYLIPAEALFALAGELL